MWLWNIPSLGQVCFAQQLTMLNTSQVANLSDRSLSLKACSNLNLVQLLQHFSPCVLPLSQYSGVIEINEGFIFLMHC